MHEMLVNVYKICIQCTESHEDLLIIISPTPCFKVEYTDLHIVTEFLEACRLIFLSLFGKIDSRHQMNEPTTSGNLTVVSGAAA